MTTGRINQVAFLDDAVTAWASRPRGRPLKAATTVVRLATNAYLFGQQRGPRDPIPTKLSASESSSETPWTIDTQQVRHGPRRKLWSSSRDAPERATRDERRTMGRANTFTLGTQQRKPDAWPRLKLLFDHQWRGMQSKMSLPKAGIQPTHANRTPLTCRNVWRESGKKATQRQPSFAMRTTATDGNHFVQPRTARTRRQIIDSPQ